MPTDGGSQLGEDSVGRKAVTELSFVHVGLETLGDIHVPMPML